MQYIFSNLYYALTYLRNELATNGRVVTTESWQGIHSNIPPMLEVLNVGFTANIPHTLAQCAVELGPNLEWAEATFEERVGGKPTNPGETYKIWPWYGNHKDSNSKFQKEEKFSHTYQERSWPKFASEFVTAGLRERVKDPNVGIRYAYGDLGDVINLLTKEPHTRQAYLPIWFPEDTGVLHGGRVPCTLGYHFILRDNKLHITYYIRACDALRHLRNDIYLTVKLLYWVLDQLPWVDVVPGTMTMHIVSLHCFEKEKNLI